MRASATNMTPSLAPRLRVVVPLHERTPIDVLVRRARTGDREAAHALYEAHVDYLAGMCTRLLRNRQDAMDVVQDAFVIAFTKLSTLEDDGAFRPWIAQTAARLARKRLRRGAFLKVFGLGGADEELSLPALAREDTSAEARSELAAIDRVLVTLPHEARTAWLLRHVENEPLEVVAAACECSLATVKRRIADADDKIRAALGDPS